ncbi:glycosyltransferase family 4 protein [Winogradskyella sp. PG-2]|uniref:glycosyltransferase family 4 protein n=1 Tax=Winogradskyella sp. PG-2 TaxID=754409 RepID=UPI0004587C10|nr:glycosyltransferase family 4 protein [Winogradskyella sp. PG-2]BAO74393.1 glycosyl transferase, group 1 [Winogradskyella sp. PG-2]
MIKRNKTLSIFTLVVHKEVQGNLYGYAPYIREMNMWISHYDQVLVVSPFSKSKELEEIDLNYSHSNLRLMKIPEFNVKSILSIIKLVFNLPVIIYKMAKVMHSSDHLHFRCPSNVSAVAAVVQVFFPSRPKSTKYAGNWDPNSNQPLGYRFQKWLLSNTYLTKKMKVLVYGEWKNQSKSVVPFMSATYAETEKLPFKKRNFSEKLKFVFIGAMVIGKRPLLTVKIIQALLEKGIDSELHMFGDGILIDEVRAFISDHNLDNSIVIHGNQNKEVVKTCLLDAHFTILPSKSEGWPKAIAEGMFFGAIPISTEISCLPWILDYGKRGILIDSELNNAVNTIVEDLNKGDAYLNTMSKNAQVWSQEYTVNRLQQEIEKVVNQE